MLVYICTAKISLTLIKSEERYNCFRKEKKGICQDPVKKEKVKGGEASQDLKERHPSSHQ